MNDAIGIIEMFGFVTAITAADAAAKAADVKVIAIDSNKPANADSVEVPLIMAVKVQGSVSAVTAADCINIIMKDLVKLMEPKYLEVKGIFTPRGGISIYPFANYGQPGTKYEKIAENRLFDSLK